MAAEIIIELQADEWTLDRIASEFGISRCLVSEINAGNMHRVTGFQYPARPRLKKSLRKKQAEMEFYRDELDLDNTYTLHYPR